MASRIRSFFSAPRRRRQQAGVALVESLIIPPTIFLLTFATLEITNILRIYETMSWTAEYAVRQASEGIYADGQRYTSQVLRTIIINKLERDLPVGAKHLYEEFPDTLQGDIFCVIYYREGESDDLSDSDFVCEGTNFPNEVTDFHPGDFVRVRLRLHYKPMLSGLFQWMFPDGALTMSSTFDRVISAEAPPPPPL